MAIPQIKRAMNLTEAQRIGLRPHVYRPGLWERALSILKRWASEPCLQREYEKRLRMCRKVYAIYTETLARQQRREEWMRKHLRITPIKRKTKTPVIVKTTKRTEARRSL